jgi:hypothetical protein
MKLENALATEGTEIAEIKQDAPGSERHQQGEGAGQSAFLRALRVLRGEN